MYKQKKFDTLITAKSNPFKLNLKETARYKDLIWLFVQRDFKTKYKQTILGPLWFIIQPLLTTFIFTIVFGQIAKLSTDGVPQFLFYLAGNVPWLFFSSCLTRTSATFYENIRLFGRVYFPRIAVPISTVITCFFNFLIQFVMFVIIDLILILTGANTHITWYAALFPLLILELGILGMGVGIIISSLTVKYRDLQVLVSFGMQLWMYISPVVYSVSSIENTTLKTLIMLNPVSPVIEFMRAGWLGVGTTNWMCLGISLAVTAVIAFLGLVIFNKTEKNFMDKI
ncbi:MAG: ABC transporter permease [Clostridia bacterium]|nr:ABC transporter permease [Clostridia bacterium]